MPEILSEKLVKKIEVTEEMIRDARDRMTTFRLDGLVTFHRALIDVIEAEAARLAYMDCYRMVTAHQYVSALDV